MLKEKEKRIFWIVVMAIATVSLVSALLSSFVVSVDYLINMEYNYLSEVDVQFNFSIALLMLAFFAIVVAAIAHLATKGRRSSKAKINWAAIIGGYFLLSNVMFAVCYYEVSGVEANYTYESLISYVTATLSIAISYEIAFLAQMMLSRKPKQTENQPAETESDEN